MSPHESGTRLRTSGIYAAIFRYGGIVFAILSLVVCVMVGLDIVEDGFVIVNGHPSRELSTFAIAVGTPLLGVLGGLVLYWKYRPVRPEDD